MKYVKQIGTHTLTFILGAIIFGSIGIAVAENIASSTVDYNKNSQATVEDALDDLYSKADSCTSGYNFADYIILIYNINNKEGFYNLYYHDQQGTYGTYEAGDYSYRYSGESSSVNNYVCFGSNESNCPTDSLYRIIGLFKDTNNEYQAKLIKATASTSEMLGTNGDYYSGNTYYWNYSSESSSTNTWSISRLNTINLNTNYVNYLNNLDTKWMGYIDTHTWIVGGNTWALLGTTSGAQNVYAKEITTPVANTTYSDEIGLMYVSDYMYGASPTYWNKMGYNQNNSSGDMRAAAENNWLYLGSNEWLITRKSDTSTSAFDVNYGGCLSNNGVYNSTYIARPVFYLKPTVKYKTGTGTSSDPYRIA